MVTAACVHSTTIRAGSRLIAPGLKDHSLAFDDLAVADTDEVILLRGRPRTRDDGTEDFFDRGDLIEYQNDATTLRFRQEVQAINGWLRAADIGFDLKAAKRGVLNAEVIHSIDHADPTARQLRRYFSRGSFQSGGRLFGGFWQNIERQARLRGLRINGEAVISLDCSQFNPLLGLQRHWKPTATGRRLYALWALSDTGRAREASV